MHACTTSVILKKKSFPIPLFYINNWLAHFSNVAIQSMGTLTIFKLILFDFIYYDI